MSKDEVNSGLLAACKALLPYAESARVPGPAMSDPWGPPTEVVLRAKEAIAKAEAAKPTPKIEVYSRPECVFRYCPYADVCRGQDRCQHAAAGNTL